MLVFIVDSADRLRLPWARQELHKLLDKDPDLPVVVVANKQVRATGGCLKPVGLLIHAWEGQGALWKDLGPCLEDLAETLSPALYSSLCSLLIPHLFSSLPLSSLLFASLSSVTLETKRNNC